MDDEILKRRFYPESGISGFSHIDGTIGFFNQLAAVVKPSDTILDFGAGRGGALSEDSVAYRRELGSFKGRCRHVDGCDVDPVVLQNPYIDQAEVLRPGVPLPYEDSRFDLVIARHVFEHVEAPEFVAQELLRVTKPGGLIAAITPNKWGYIAIAARLVPNRYHVRVLSQSQPHRKPEDVFPTQYKLNTPRSLQRAFGDHAEIVITKKGGDPAYHFGRPLLYRFVRWINKHSPDALLPVLDVYIRKI